MKKTNKAAELRKATFPAGYRTLSEIREAKPRKKTLPPASITLSKTHLSQSELQQALAQLEALKTR